MTRDEYRQLIKTSFSGGGWEYYWQHINFPELVRSVAVELFYRQDFTSPLAVETHRRYKQIREIGETDP
jgi:hypothetical protein